jgi:hypothetical protein
MGNQPYTDPLQARSVAFVAVAIAISVLLYFFSGSIHHNFSAVTHQSLGSLAFGQLPSRPWHNHDSRILKTTSMLGPENDLYEAALRSHEEHNRHFGYRMEVQRNIIVDNYSSLPAWLLSVVITELNKPESSRAEWLM